LHIIPLPKFPSEMAIIPAGSISKQQAFAAIQSMIGTEAPQSIEEAAFSRALE